MIRYVVGRESIPGIIVERIRFLRRADRFLCALCVLCGSKPGFASETISSRTITDHCLLNTAYCLLTTAFCLLPTAF